MIRRYALWSSTAKLGVALLLLALTALGTQVSSAQTNKPELPTLSLTGSGANWNAVYYPDGRIWIPRRGTNGERTLLVPVFIKNCWRTTDTYEAFPIYSFKTKIQFDSTALEFMGVEKNGPIRGVQGLPIGCLAKDFEFSTSVARDTSFQRVIGGPLQNRLRGKRVLITAVSSKALPQTGDPTTTCDQRPFVELFYMRFRVVANPAQNPVSARTPIILTNDTLFYNDFQVGYELPFPGDPVPTTFAGLGGADNFYLDQFNQEQIRDPLRPSRPGMIWVEVTDEIPRLSFTLQADRRFRIVDSVDNSNNADWFVVDPITVDSGSKPQPYVDEVNGLATRDIDVINATAGTRMTDVLVQSDSKWLLFKSFRRGGVGEIDPFPQPVREGVITILDKGIQGTTLGVTPMGDATTLQRDLNMRIICDWTKVKGTEDPDGEFAGVYVGYLTFKSMSMDVSPVRIKVTFIVFRPPFEPNEFDADDNWKHGIEEGGSVSGIALEIRNSNNPIERTNIVFGVGARATDFVDTLFGETVHTAPLGSFGARFYPRDENGNDIYQYGLGDLFSTTYDPVTLGPGARSSSRDIRDIYSDSTLQYWVKFNAGSALNYPIVVSWDVASFPPGASLFIRDTLNGSRFNLNMRQGTSLGGTRYSITIRDADITAFVIEYTLPRVMQFPVITKGWNLLSVPVNPSSNLATDVFKNALNIPVRFTQNIYQASPLVTPGVGYFIKYSDNVDKTVAGTRIYRIDDTHFPTRMYPGWNTIGSISVPVGIENVDFFPITGSSTGFPEKEGDIYRYLTSRGYVPVTEITPGLGYWVKVTDHAFLIIDDPTRSEKAGVASTKRQDIVGVTTLVNVRDNDNKYAELYLDEQRVVSSFGAFELPPLPPSNLFDVRFGNQAYVENSVTPVINMQGATFPVSVTVNNPSRNYTAVNAITGEVLGTVAAGTTSVIKVTDARTPSVRLLGDDVNLAASSVSVTPNPVSTGGAVDFTVSQAGNVNVALYNAVGEQVAVLFNGDKSTGVYTIDLNGGNFAPGRYMLKLINAGTVATASVTIVR